MNLVHIITFLLDFRTDTKLFCDAQHNEQD